MKIVQYLLLTLITLTTILQAAPKIGDVMRQIEVPKEFREPKSNQLVEIQGVKAVLRPELKDDKSAKKVYIKEFRIDGNKSIKSELLINLLYAYANKELSFNDMQITASVVTKEYRRQGYIVARAYIPVQNVHDGILEITVIEGVYGEFKFTNNTQLDGAMIQSVFDINKTGMVIKSDSLERSLLLVNDIPGVVISNATIQAGKSVGSSDFLIHVNKSNPYDGYVLLNNYGGRYTGNNQLTAGLNLNNPFDVGDKLSVVGLISSTTNLSYGSLSYSTPLYKNGLRGEVGYDSTLYSLEEEYTSLDALGRSKNFYAKLIYPILKQREQSLNTYFKTQKSILSDEVRSTDFENDKNILAYKVGLDYTKTTSKQELKATTVVTYGDLEFVDENQEALDKSGANTQGKYSKIEFTLDYNVRLDTKIILENSFKYQHTLRDKNLDGSEDFSIGGAYGVKLYPSGEISAENGYQYTLEAKYSLENYQQFSHTLGVFYDIGKVYMKKPTATFQSRTLQDIGVGYYSNYDKFFSSLQVAWKIDNENITSEPARAYKFLWMLGYSF